jgi:hypothetical protein
VPPPGKDDGEGSGDGEAPEKSAREKMTEALVAAAAGVVKKMKKKEAQDLDGLLQVTVLGAYWLQLRHFNRARRFAFRSSFRL